MDDLIDNMIFITIMNCNKHQLCQIHMFFDHQKRQRKTVENILQTRFSVKTFREPITTVIVAFWCQVDAANDRPVFFDFPAA